MSVKQEAVLKAFKRELARRKFWGFCMYYDEPFFKQRMFLKEVADAFQKIEDNEIKSLAVSMPPRAGKSYITSLYCAWTLGKNPEESVMRNTCTATLYLKFSYDVRAIIKSKEFMEVFPEVVLSDDKKNLQGWNTNQSRQVSYFGSGVGGTIIGFGATRVGITDDLYRGVEDALSDTVNNRIIQWKQSTHDSRFESGCSRIDIGTRWSIHDVIGMNSEEGVYDEQIIVAALTESEQSFCESVMTTDEYLEKRKRTAKEIWLAEYMQTPVDVSGRLFNDINYLDSAFFEANIKDNLEGCIGYIDVADEGKDFTAMAILGVCEDKLYVVDYLFSRENTDVTIPICRQRLQEWNVSYCRVESNSMGAMFGRTLQQGIRSKILLVRNSVNKMTRIIMQSAFIQNQMTFVQYDNRECTQFLENVVTFSKEGKNKNDDAPDCLAGLSIFAQSMFKQLT